MWTLLKWDTGKTCGRQPVPANKHNETVIVVGVDHVTWLSARDWSRTTSSAAAVTRTRRNHFRRQSAVSGMAWLARRQQVASLIAQPTATRYSPSSTQFAVVATNRKFRTKWSMPLAAIHSKYNEGPLGPTLPISSLPPSLLRSFLSSFDSVLILLPPLLLKSSYNQLYSSKNSIAVIKEKRKHKIKKNKRANKQQVTGIRRIANCPAD